MTTHEIITNTFKNYVNEWTKKELIDFITDYSRFNVKYVSWTIQTWINERLHDPKYKSTSQIFKEASEIFHMPTGTIKYYYYQSLK